MDEKLTKSAKIWSLKNEQTYPTVQTFIHSKIRHEDTL